MVNITLKLLGFFILVLTANTTLNAQFEIGLQIGKNQLEGDAHCLEDSEINVFSPTGAAIGAFLKYNIPNTCFGARLHYTNIPMKFDESRFGSAGHKTRYYVGKNKANDLSLELMYNLFCKKRLSPYVFAGVGAQFANYDINFNEGPKSARIKALIAEDKKAGTTHFILPVGAGLQFRLTERWKVHVEGSMRLPVNDYYDGISKSANPEFNDWYGYAVVGLSYLLKGEPDADKDGIADKKDECPDVFGLKAFGGCPDTDADGIKDSEDRCSKDFGLAEYKGCPDGDGDTVPNIDDECPEVKGLTTLKGCPDRDADGLADDADQCPDEKGVLALKGCPDGDGDNITDKDDKCPTEKGTAALKGCPDTDGDGIANREDACPDKFGLSANKGCPPADTDGDGVADSEDKCPTVAGTKANGGCAEVAAVPVTTVGGPACVACATSTDPIFTSNVVNPKKLNRLGSNPEFGNSHALSPEQFYDKLQKAYKNNSIDRKFLDRIYRQMGYTGFSEATSSQFSDVILPEGTSGMLGYAKEHKTGAYTLPDDEYHRKAFHIRAANGCDIHFMKTCGNHFFFCNK